ncbi:hypothetical protein AVEN_212543-1 [Araneus ventricosus]|uniref:Uncharacterized protein n=1 Tax=Araneus ventricosus TaxID=182803 RepID=A0A4Y2JS35_ARAVE|nr:hypothetical protein AVEN_212543-1 [Araneus ventricosus]
MKLRVQTLSDCLTSTSFNCQESFRKYRTSGALGLLRGSERWSHYSGSCNNTLGNLDEFSKNFFRDSFHKVQKNRIIFDVLIDGFVSDTKERQQSNIVLKNLQFSQVSDRSSAPNGRTIERDRSNDNYRAEACALPQVYSFEQEAFQCKARNFGFGSCFFGCFGYVQKSTPVVSDFMKPSKSDSDFAQTAKQ